MMVNYCQFLLLVSEKIYLLKNPTNYTLEQKKESFPLVAKSLLFVGTESESDEHRTNNREYRIKLLMDFFEELKNISPKMVENYPCTTEMVDFIKVDKMSFWTKCTHLFCIWIMKASGFLWQTIPCFSSVATWIIIIIRWCGWLGSLGREW